MATLFIVKKNGVKIYYFNSAIMLKKIRKKILMILSFAVFPFLIKAQLNVGLQTGLNQLFTANSDSLLKYERLGIQKKMNISPIVGLMFEFPINKNLFLSSNHSIQIKKHLVYEGRGGIPFNHICYSSVESSIILNIALNKQFSIGGGINNISISNLKFYESPNDRCKKNWNDSFLSDSDGKFGMITEISYKLNNFLIKLNYAHNFWQYKSVVDWFKHVSSCQFNVAYLFKTNLKFSKKGLDCPRF